jgi:hypothetical protein
MKRLSVLSIAVVFAISCGSSSTTTGPTGSPTKPTFTATLLPSNETATIVGGENTGSGTATVTFDVTTDSSGTIKSGTATFVVNLSGFPPNTPINIAHIHQAPAGASGGIVFSTTLAAGEVNLVNGSGSFVKAGIAPSPADASIFQAIINNPSAFYFNVHSTLNPGGVARGQLQRVQ